MLFSDCTAMLERNGHMLGELTKSIVITISGFGVVDATSAAECEESVCGACAARYGVLSARDVHRG